MFSAAPNEGGKKGKRFDSQDQMNSEGGIFLEERIVTLPALIDIIFFRLPYDCFLERDKSITDHFGPPERSEGLLEWSDGLLNGPEFS